MIDRIVLLRPYDLRLCGAYGGITHVLPSSYLICSYRQIEVLYKLQSAFRDHHIWLYDYINFLSWNSCPHCARCFQETSRKVRARQLGPKDKREKFTMTCGNGDPVCSLMNKPGEMTSCLCLICGAKETKRMQLLLIKQNSRNLLSLSVSR